MTIYQLMSNADYDRLAEDYTRGQQIAAELNADQTIIERHGRMPNTIDDPIWAEWNAVAAASLEAIAADDFLPQTLDAADQL